MADTKAPAQAALAADAGAAEPVHPEPPYTNDHDDQLEAGLQCYYPGCESKSHTYGSLFKHVTNVRGAHKRSMKALKGTYLHDKGCKDINEKQRERYKHSKAKADEAPPGAAAKKTKVGQAAIAPPAAGAGDAAESGGTAQNTTTVPAEVSSAASHSSGTQPDASNQAQQIQHPPAHVWLAKKCWVKCQPDGTPIEPLEVRGLVDRDGPATQLPMAQGALAPCIELGKGPQSPAPSVPRALKRQQWPA
jgi:hypothetical protein